MFKQLFILAIANAFVALLCLAKPEVVDADTAVTDQQRVILDLSGPWQGHSIDGLVLDYPSENLVWETISVPHENSKTQDGVRLIRGSRFGPNISEVLTSDRKAIKPEWREKTGAWFRREFRVQSDWFDGRRAILVLEGAGYRHCVWVNGQLIGESLIGLVPAQYDVTDALNHDGVNELVIAVGNAATLVDVEKQTFLAPAVGIEPGIWKPITLNWIPDVSIKDIFVTTSVKNEQIRAQVTLRNTQNSPETVKLSGLIQDTEGHPVAEIAPITVTVPANSQVQASISKNWLAPNLWTPESPALYQLVISIAGHDRLVDQQIQKFGYREFEIRGKSFYLNGKPITLFRKSMLANLATSTDRALQLARRDAGNPYNCWRLHLGFNSQAMVDAADQVGLMVMPESAWYHLSKFNLRASDVWLPQIEAYTKKLVRIYRNNPSVIIWSLTNETMWDHTDDIRMDVAGRILEAARSVDDTRPFAADGDNDWDQQLDVTVIHYPEGEIQTDLARRYPNAGLLYPNMFEWLREDGINRAWRADFEWDRPLIIGEYWYPNGASFLGRTSYAGETTFDWRLNRYGEGAAYSSNDIPHDPAMWVLRGMTDRYRLQGVAGLNPWYGDHAEAMPLVAVRPLDFHPNFRGGKTGTRKVVVFNSTNSDYARMHLQCRLVADGKTVWSDTINSHVSPSDAKTFDISIKIPSIKYLTQAKLIVRLLHEQSGHWRELSRHEESIFIWPPVSPLSDMDAADLLVISTDQALGQMLDHIGLHPDIKAVLTPADLANKRIILIGPGAKIELANNTLAQFVADGGRVIQLQAEETLFAGMPAPDPLHAATRAWSLADDHPILKGLHAGMFSFWRPDNLVATSTLRKQPGSSARYLLECGGSFGMQWASLVETPIGRGTVLVCQMPLTRAFEVEPAAEEIFARLIRYAESFTPASTQPLVVWANDDQQGLFKAIQAANIQTTDRLDESSGPILVDASAKLTADQISQLSDRLEAGGNVWLHGFGPDSLNKVAPLLSFDAELLSFDARKTQGAVVVSDDPLIQNISNQDLAWYHYQPARGDFFAGSKPTAALGRFILNQLPLDRTEKLVEPGLLLKIQVGSGTVLFDTLLWSEAMSTENDKVIQLVGSLAMNLGATINTFGNTDNYDYHPVSLSRYVNMGFYDPVAGDGKGGWTDQGDNDMRFFLTNHTGKEGGREDAMEVAAAPMPKHVTFLGRKFDMIDPKKNGGKAVISLRGQQHGEKLPAEVKDIQVDRTADRLWFLHTAGWLGEAKQEVGQFVIHYADHSKVVVPIRAGVEVGDWWDPEPLPQARVAWSGRNLVHAPIGIYLTEWKNPHPEKVIEAIDIVGARSSAQWVVLAITAGTKPSQ